MFSYVFGPAGSGKSFEMTARILASLRDGKRVFLIAPEQEVMLAEGRIAEAADAAEPRVSCEELNVVSFKRLADLVFRRYAGIRYVSPTDGARLVVMWQVTEELAPAFRAYTEQRDISFSEFMLSACDELRRSAVTPSQLEAAERELGDDEQALKDKLHDLSLIYSGYQAMMQGSYTDPADDITRLYALLCENRFFKGSDVYLDSFNGFTSAELKVLSRILRQADNVTVALCLPTPTPRSGFETVLQTVSSLKGLCNEAGIGSEKIRELYLERSESYYPEALIKLERLMRTPTVRTVGAAPFSDAVLDGGRRVSLSCPIQPVSPSDMFTEAEYTATRILELIRNGARFRDIAVVTRGVERLRGVLEPTFVRFGIPYFTSVRRQLSVTPLFKAVLGALTVIDGGWHTADVMAYLKTGELGFDISEISLLERYTTQWDISGKAWTADLEWTMNPDGYTDRMTLDGAQTLDTLNALREAVRAPVAELGEALSRSPAKSVSLQDGCRAVYAFLERSGITERYSVTDDAEAVTLYNTFIDMLDMLVTVGGDIPVNARTLGGILSMAAKKTDFGAIPETADCVTVGDAALLRAGSVRHVIMLDCIDGVFPRSVDDDSFFSDTEKKKLAGVGIRTSPGTDVMADDEQFYFYRAISAASETVSVVCPRNDGGGAACHPSPAFGGVLSLFGIKAAPRYPEDFPLSFRAASTVNVSELLRSVPACAEREALEIAASETLKKSGFYGASRISDPDAYIEKETVDRLFRGGDIKLTQYRLESFSRCRFSYYARYVLKMNADKRSNFSAADEGSFIHRVLEKAVSELFDDRGLKSEVDKKHLDDLLNETVEEILRGMLGDNKVFTASARLSALIGRLKKRIGLLLRALIEEFSQSNFVPSYFELDIGDNGVTPFKVKMPDGASIYVYGKIDRVDTYSKNGDVFVRVVDYKSGSVEHSLKKISKGLDMQLLLYMFALWNADRRRLRGPLGITLVENSELSTKNDTPSAENANILQNDIGHGRIIPAGVLYQTAAFPSVPSELPPPSDEKAISEGLKKFTSTGFLLDDAEILTAMDNTLGGRFIPISAKDDVIAAVGGSQLTTLEGFGELREQVSDTLREIGKALRSGKAEARPLRGEEPCEYCEYASFCRNKLLKD